MNHDGKVVVLLVFALLATSASGTHAPPGLGFCTPSEHSDCPDGGDDGGDDPPGEDFSPRWPHPAAACSEPYHVQWAGWDLCWQQEDARVQGLEVNRAFFHNGSVAWKMGVPFSLTRYEEPFFGPGPFKDVLGRPGIDGWPGFGQGSMRIPAEDCPRFLGDGRLLNDGRVCLEHRAGPEPAVALWARYDLYNYRFLQGWTFDARGHIEPFISMGGNLIDGSSAGADGQDHQHHLYWRIDFDIAASGNDTFQAFKRAAGNQLEFEPLGFLDGSVRSTCQPQEGVTGTAWCDMWVESKVLYDKSTHDKWRVMDLRDLNARDHGRGFEFVVHSDGPSDEFSTFDALVLQYAGDSEEIGYEVPSSPLQGDYAVNSYLLPSGSPGPVISDPVVWVTQHVDHDTRDEDRGTMSLHHAGFDIRPRNFVDQNPGEATYP